MAFPKSNLGSENILRDVHDPALQALRTTTTATIIAPPNFDVDITHTEDSVRLGDGVNFITSTTVGTQTALDVNPLSTGTTLNVFNLSMPLNTVTYTFNIPIGTKRINLKSRLGGKLKINFNLPLSSGFITVYPGSLFFQDNLLTDNSIILYAQSTLNGDTLEILLVT